jgi:hydroxypyruvate isomerase
MEFEAIEINNPYGISPSHLASLLQNEETGEALQLACIDTYCGPIDAPISNYQENDMNDFINNNINPALSDQSDVSSIATTTQASLAYLNSDHTLFPRDGLDGYASIPGTLFAYNNSITTTFTYASVISIPCVNILPGTIGTQNELHANIFNDIMKTCQVIYVNNSDDEYHDSSCNCSNTNNKSEKTVSDSTFLNTLKESNPVYQILNPSPVELQRLTCCPPHSMVVKFTLPLYLTQSFDKPTVTPTILAILPLPHVQSMDNIVNNTNTANNTSSTMSIDGNTGQCGVLAKYYAHIQKTQHLNNKSYFLMKKLLPSTFLHENYHHVFDVYHNSFYIPEVVELYQHYYSELYRILNGPNNNNNTPNSTTNLSLISSTPNSSATPRLSLTSSDEKSLFQFLLQLSQSDKSEFISQFGQKSAERTKKSNINEPLTPTQSSIQLNSQQHSPPQQSGPLSPTYEDREKNPDKNDKSQQQQQRSFSNTLKSVPSPFTGLGFPIHTAYSPINTGSSTSGSSTRHSGQNSAVPPQTPHNQQQTPNDSITKPTPTQNNIIDLSSPRFDYFLTSLIFTTLVFNVKLVARNASRNDQIRDQLSITLSINPNTYLSTLFRLLRVLVFCSSDNIGILYDTAAIYQQHGNIITLFERLSPLIRHLKVSNIHPELDNTILFNAIHQLNYIGWVTLDFSMSNMTIPTKKVLYPWFPHYLRRRNGSAGVLFMCRGKQGKVYVLLGQELKHGSKAVGPFWGRPDKTDLDIEMTAVRETIEESLGCVVNNPTVLYSALKNRGFFYKCPRINLYLVNIGVLGVKERNDVANRYTWLRHTIMTNSQFKDGMSLLGGGNNNNNNNMKIDASSLNPAQALPSGLDDLAVAGRDKQLTKSLMEMNEVLWVDLYDMYKHYILKSHRLLQEYGIVTQPAPTSASTPGSPGVPLDDDKKDGKKKKDKKDDKKEKEKEKGKKGKNKNNNDNNNNNNNDDDNEQDLDGALSPGGNNANNNNNQERETTVLQPPHNSEHTITSLINTITQQRPNYNNLPLRRFFIREMLYMWLTDPNWLNLVHKRDFNIHSIEKLIHLHQQQLDKNKSQNGNSPQQTQQTQQQQQQQQQPNKKNSRPVNPDDDVDHKQWRSAPL